MDTLRYVLKRIFLTIPVLIIVSILAFALVHLIPGDPVAVLLGEHATPEATAALTEKYGLDKTLPEQYFMYLKNILHGDLGTSIRYNRPALELIGKRITVTLGLTGMALLFVIIISFPLGYLAGMKKDKLPDYLVKLFSLLGLSIPSFWVGLMLLLVFGVNLKWFPVSGWGNTIAEHIKSLFLPAMTQAFATAALVVRNLRNNVIDVRNCDYVKFAKSKGLPEKDISIYHIIRNALMPTVTLISMQCAMLVGGSVVIESIFTLPGMGALLVESVYSRDYAVVQSLILVFAVEVMIINLITDILYSLIDPRIKLS